ncbi:hypothetical protein ACLB2K_004457 [Fragaria x ananassa]
MERLIGYNLLSWYPANERTTGSLRSFLLQQLTQPMLPFPRELMWDSMSSLKVDCSSACNHREPSVTTMINPAHLTYGRDPYAHPNDTDLRYGTYEDYEDLEIAIGNGVAVGKNSIGLSSDVTDARTLVVEEGREVCIIDFDYDIENEAFVRPTEDNPLAHLTSALQSPENLEIPRRGTTQNKRSRAEYEGNSNSTRGTPQSGVTEKLDKLHSGFESMITLLEKRDRQSKIWDAIKEIPNLDEATCFTALELLDTKTKKDAFFNMSPQERSNWIFHKMGGF